MPKVSRLQGSRTGRGVAGHWKRSSGSSSRAIAAHGRLGNCPAVWPVDRSIVHLAAAGAQGATGRECRACVVCRSGHCGSRIGHGSTAASCWRSRGMEIVLADGLRVILEQGVDPGALARLAWSAAPPRYIHATGPKPSGGGVPILGHEKPEGPRKPTAKRATGERPKRGNPNTPIRAEFGHEARDRRRSSGQARLKIASLEAGRFSPSW